MAAEAFFLPVAAGQRFCLYYAPAGETRAVFLYLHPFAEEMNKSRRMAALMSRRLAEHGLAVLQIDLAGCGDSSGDFGDASWQAWLDDIAAALDWLRVRHDAPLWLWGLRSGCLLAAEAARRTEVAANFLFWQPVITGRTFLQQFLRLKLAGEMLGGEAKGVMATLKQRLAAGEAVEIVGYALSPALAQGLESATLAPPNRPGRLLWFELSSRADATLAPASQKCLEQWQAAEFSVASAVLPAPSFWQTTEIEEAPALIEATLAALQT
ncbi:hydrolase 2, exosortase A system-associated [Sulfuricystis multivorans]|uniref:hydrolase 2, exosortase A system-associated n=1 Tax=Sulfuricystis multivorans TaxID=2211108 RepID=UPI000F826413|nr:hydrolase 2, exosortase A system-associated [Sulfuricystis multivorans]